MPHARKTGSVALHPALASIALLRSDGAVLFQHRDDKVGLSCAGEWVFPGGHTAADEPISICAAREFKEETDYNCKTLRFLGNHRITVGLESFDAAVFWDRYDDTQEIQCFEGQAMEFIKRDLSAIYNIAPSFTALWDETLRVAGGERSTASDQCFEQYTPIDYSLNQKWGAGDNIRGQLPPIAVSAWDRALPYQDKRDDPGQGEIVTHFTLVLSRVYKLSPADTEIVSLAAIFHDTGYARMERINERFRVAAQGELPTAIAQKSGPDTSMLKDYAGETLLQIRICHQEESVRIASEILSAYPADRVETISAIIGDHDTRFHPPSQIGKLVWDADILWRMTVPHRNSWAAEATADRVFEMMQTQVMKVNNLSTEAAHTIARIELANTMTTLFQRAAWPEAFVLNYTRELIKLGFDENQGIESKNA